MDDATLLKLITDGDCGVFTPQQKISYYRARCEAAGLDYRTEPFQFIKMQGRTILYAKKSATDQLTSKNHISCQIVDRALEDGICTVTVRATAADGRYMDDIGAVPTGGLKGADLANAQMKANTKARRRAILSLCGLGMLDESELDTVKSQPDREPPPLPRRKSETPPADKEDAVAEAIELGIAAKIDLPLNDLPWDIAAHPNTLPAVDPSNERLTDNQRRSLYAARSRAGMSKEQAKEILAAMGYSSSTAVQRRHYEDAIGAFDTWTEEGHAKLVDYLQLWAKEQ